MVGRIKFLVHRQGVIDHEHQGDIHALVRTRKRHP
jgi:hypothetical protein